MPLSYWMHLISLYISLIVYLHTLFNSPHRMPSCLIDLLNMIFFGFLVVHDFLIFTHIIPINFNFASKNVSFLDTLLTIRAIIASIFLWVVSISLVTWYLMNTHSLFKISLIHNHHPTFTQTLLLSYLVLIRCHLPKFLHLHLLITLQINIPNHLTYCQYIQLFNLQLNCHNNFPFLHHSSLQHLRPTRWLPGVVQELLNPIPNMLCLWLMTLILNPHVLVRLLNKLLGEKLWRRVWCFITQRDMVVGASTAIYEHFTKQMGL